MQTLVNIDQKEQSTFNILKATINNIFLFIYHLEFFIKLMGLGMNYFQNNWNNLDLSILIIADMVLIFSLLGKTLVQKELPTIARAFRVFRIVKYVKASK